MEKYLYGFKLGIYSYDLITKIKLIKIKIRNNIYNEHGKQNGR